MDIKSFITLAPGAKMGHRYVLQLLFENNNKSANNSTTKDRKKSLFGIPRIFYLT